MTTVNDDLIRAFLAGEGQRAVAAALPLDEAVGRLAPRIKGRRSGTSKRLIVLLAATLLLVAALGTAVAVGSGLLRLPAVIDNPRSEVTLASGSFTAPLLASNVTTVDIEAVGTEPRLEGWASRSATPASGSMGVSDASGRFSVELQCTRWTGELLIGGEVIDSTHRAAAEGSRVVIALHPRTVITALMWFEGPPAAPTCEGFLEGISPIDMLNKGEPVVGVMRVGTYAADCDRGCTPLDQ